MRLSRNLFTFKQIAEKADHALVASVILLIALINFYHPTRSTQHMQLRRGHSYALYIAKLYVTTVQRLLCQSMPV